MDVVTHPDPEAVGRAAAELIAVRAATGTMTLGLAGGSSPVATYDALNDVDIDWSDLSLWLSDERWVPHDHEESNGRMALQHLPAAAADRLIRPRFSPYVTPVDSAVHYDAALRSIHGDQAPPLVLLGMGTDGHTASLFPDSPALQAEPNRWFVANHISTLDAWRLTVTPSLLQIAEHVVVLVTGRSKAAVLAEVIEGPDGRYPIQLLRHAQGKVTVLCDGDAASALSG